MFVHIGVYFVELEYHVIGFLFFYSSFTFSTNITCSFQTLQLGFLAIKKDVVRAVRQFSVIQVNHIVAIVSQMFTHFMLFIIL